LSDAAWPVQRSSGLAGAGDRGEPTRPECSSAGLAASIIDTMLREAVVKPPRRSGGYYAKVREHVDEASFAELAWAVTHWQCWGRWRTSTAVVRVLGLVVVGFPHGPEPVLLAGAVERDADAHRGLLREVMVGPTFPVDPTPDARTHVRLDASWVTGAPAPALRSRLARWWSVPGRRVAARAVLRRFSPSGRCQRRAVV
jgi:hypothetical protein